MSRLAEGQLQVLPFLKDLESPVIRSPNLCSEPPTTTYPGSMLNHHLFEGSLVKTSLYK